MPITASTRDYLQPDSFRILDVRVTRTVSGQSGYQWKVFESNGQLLEASTRTYATDGEALREGNAAARKIRRTGRC